MHVAEEVNVAEAGVGVARLVLAEVVAEEHVQLLPLPDDDEPHVPGALGSDSVDDVADAAGQRGVQLLQLGGVGVDLGGRGHAKHLADLKGWKRLIWIVFYRAKLQMQSVFLEARKIESLTALL